MDAVVVGGIVGPHTLDARYRVDAIHTDQAWRLRRVETTPRGGQVSSQADLNMTIYYSADRQAIATRIGALTGRYKLGDIDNSTSNTTWIVR